jgi:hypothetical protein
VTERLAIAVLESADLSSRAARLVLSARENIVVWWWLLRKMDALCSIEWLK